MIFHIDLDCFFVSVERLLDPSLCGKPVVVGYDQGNKGVVASASYEARAFGIHSAMPMMYALQRCPQVVRVRPRHHRYSEISKEIMTFLGTYSPEIKVASVDEAYVDMAGTQRLWGPPEEAAALIHKQVKERFRLPLSVGAGCNATVAKIATGRAKPDGVLVVPPGGERDFLYPLPVKVVPGVGPHLEAVLKHLGITTIGHLVVREDALLKAEAGGYAVELARLLRNPQPCSVAAQRARRKSLSVVETFMEPVTDVCRLRQWLLEQVRRLGSHMRDQGLACNTLRLTLRTPKMDTFQHQRRAAMPLVTDAEIIALALPLLNELLPRTGGVVRLVGLALGDLKPREDAMDFFPSRRDRRIALQRVIDGINVDLGGGHVCLGLLETAEKRGNSRQKP